MTVPEFHSEVDKVEGLLIAKSSKMGNPVTCRVGCAWCCSEPLFVERREVQHILETLTPEQKEQLKPRAKEWAERFKASGIGSQEEPHVMSYRALKLPCPFLEKNLCSVYENRPWSCRSHMVIGPPSMCEDNSQRMQQKYVFSKETSSYLMQKILKSWSSLEMDHLGALLAEELLGEKLETQARCIINVV